jgi:tellurite resistance protein TerA
MTNFMRGQKQKLSDLNVSATLDVQLSIAPGAGHVVDLAAFGLNGEGRLSDDRYFIFYNQRSTPCGSLSLTGAAVDNGATFHLELGGLPPSVQRIVFTATLDSPGTMAEIGRSYLRLLAAGGEVARFQFQGSDFGPERAIIVGEIYRKDVWRFAATGQGFAGGLKALLTHFGGEALEDTSPRLPPASPTRPASPATVSPATAPPPAPPLAPAAKVNLGKLTLDKRGSVQSVDLRKGDKAGAGRFHVNLNWANPNVGRRRGFFGLSGNDAVDLDLGCMYRLTDGSAGVIQPLGGNYGSKSSPPYIYLDKDDRTGTAADGENLYLERPDLIDKAVLFALIYEGTGNFSTVNGQMLIRDDTGTEILVRLDSPDSHRLFCAVVLITRDSGRNAIAKEERYFAGHKQCDDHYGFGFRWTAASK